MLVLALASVVLALLLGNMLEILYVTIPPWADGPSVLVIFGVLYRLFDSWAWRFSIWKKVRLVQVPCLAGEWEGHSTTSFDDHSMHHPVRVKVEQSWTSISLFFSMEKSHSHSLTASILVHQPGGTTVSYEYRNEPRVDAQGTMHSHRGTAVLKLVSNNHLEGDYYTGRDRQTCGTMVLDRKTNGQPR